MLTSITIPVEGEKYNSNRRNHLMVIFGHAYVNII